MILKPNQGTNRDVALLENFFILSERLWTDAILHDAFNRVGVDGYFDMDEYLKIHSIITQYWEELGGDIYLGDLMLCEAIVRNIAADNFIEIECPKTVEFIETHRPKRHEDGSLMHGIAASVDEVLEFITDLKSMVGIVEFCENTKFAYATGDRDKIEQTQLKENYLAERYRSKRGYMDKLGYNEAFSVLRDLLLGKYKQDSKSPRLRERIEQGLQFWDY